MLIPNVAAWIIGDMARHIIHHLSDRHDFVFFPESLFYRRPDLFGALLPSIDLIHCLNESAAPLVIKAAGASSLPPIMTWIHHVTSWSSDHDFSARHSVALVATTPGWKDAIEQVNPSPRPTHVVRHGVDCDLYSPRPGARARFGLPADAFLFGFFGSAGSDRDAGRKGIPTLLDVVRGVASRVRNAHFVFAGPGWHDVVRDLHAAGIAASDLDFVPRSDVPFLYSALDAYLMTARVEGGPCTILESLACGTPVVATRVGLVPDVVQDGVNGFTAEVGDVAALTDGLLALAADPGRRKEMGTNGRRAVQQHTWARNLAPLGDLYSQYARPQHLANDGRECVSSPGKLLRPACAADALAIGWDRARRNPGDWLSSMRTTLRMLDGLSVSDCFQGAALLKGLSFRT